MKHLINFSLNRRFKNKVTVIMHVLIICILFVGVFFDKVIDTFFESENNLVEVYYDKSLKPYIEYMEDNIYFKFIEGSSDTEINLKKSDKFIIESEFKLNALESSTLKALLSEAILSNWLNTLSSDSVLLVLENISPEIIEVNKSENKVSMDKINISMFLITGIYFAMLSFSTMIANEVVYEKTSRVLELVLTSVSTTTHYFSKMIIAWLTVLIQIIIIVFEFSSVLVLRNIYDEGVGILKLLSKYNLIEIDAKTFRDFIIKLDINSNLITILITAFIYLMLGMVIIQMIMVCLSSFIKSIEESSVLSAPVYIVLLVIYYLALALNSPAKLDSGIGYIFSFIPVFSMLFMPMRLLLLTVSIYEILLGIILSVITLVIISYAGSYIYNIGILGGVNIRNYKNSLMESN